MDNKKASEKLLGTLPVPVDEYKFGHTKVNTCTEDLTSSTPYIYTSSQCVAMHHELVDLLFSKYFLYI